MAPNNEPPAAGPITGPCATFNRDELLCKCKKVSYGRILDLMASGTRRLFLIQKETGAATGCGQCKPLLVEFIIAHRGDHRGGP